LVLLTYLHQVFYLISAAKFVHHLAKTKKLHSFSSASLFLFNVLILCFCTILSSRTIRTNSLPDLILISVFNPRDLYYRGYKKKIIIIMHGATHYSVLDFLNAVGGRLAADREIPEKPLFSGNIYSAFQCDIDRRNFSSS